MDFKNVIDWKSFIMGAAFASFICVVASQYQLDWYMHLQLLIYFMLAIKQKIWFEELF